MTEQTKVQRLADLLETNIWDGKCGQKERDEAAAELRRLDALNAELVEALTAILENDGGEGSKHYHAFKLYDAREAGFSALAKAKEQT